MNSRASLALLLLLTLSSGSWLALAASKSAGLSDGATCYYDKNYTPMKPFCKRDFGCLVTKVVRNSPHFKFKGVCASDVPLDQITKKFCMFRSVMFAPGTSGITATSMVSALHVPAAQGRPVVPVPPGQAVQAGRAGAVEGRHAMQRHPAEPV
ncbi:hypothetical protein CLOP_g14023 [Closterium sp. NIES-67]|nr:hypothetical protein CLOP_g14023 [Closterium sp. NIES-67]